MSMPRSAALQVAGASAKRPFFRGVNFLNYGGAAGYQRAPNNTIPYYGSKGMNVVRLGLTWESIQPTLGAAFNLTLDHFNGGGMADLFTKLSRIDGYLIVELHNYMRRIIMRSTGTFTNGSNIVTAVASTTGCIVGRPLAAYIPGMPANATISAFTANTITFNGGNFTGTTTSGADVYSEVIVGETPSVTSAHLVDFWTRLATMYKDNPRVIWGIMNEPHEQNDDILLGVQNDAIAAIRATGAGQPIMVMGNGWGTWELGNANFTKLLNIVDPMNNLIFDVHLYFDNYGAGQNQDTMPSSYWMPQLTNVTAWARTNKKRLFCGEFAFANTPEGCAAGVEFLNFIEGNKDVWTGWTHLGGGGWWSYDYIFRLDPFGAQWNPANPWGNEQNGGQGVSRASTWNAPLIDQVAMSVIDDYLPVTPVYNRVPRSRAFVDNFAGFIGVNGVRPSAIDGLYGAATKTTGAAAILEDGTNGNHLYQTFPVPVVSGQTHVASFIVKQGAVGSVVRMYAYAADFGSYVAAEFNLSGGNFSYSFAGGGGVSGTGGVVALGNGFFILWMPFALTTTSVNLRLASKDSGGNESYQGVANRVMFYLDNVQVTLGATLQNQKVSNPATLPSLYGPVNTIAPTSPGTPNVGFNLVANNGTWTGAPTPTFSYVWKVDGISVSTTNSYTPVSGDLGKTLTMEVTALNIAGTKTVVVSAGVVTAANPFVITDLGATKVRAWYKPSTATVSAWPDSSGNTGRDFVQATTANQPVVDAVNGGLLFNGATKRMDSAMLSGVAAQTERVFIVFSVDTLPTTGGNTLIGGASGNCRQVFIQGGTPPLQLAFNSQGTSALGPNNNTTSGPIVAATKNLATFKGGTNGQNSIVTINGQVEDVNGSGYSTGAYSSTTDVNRIGTTTANAVRIHEIVITQLSISTAERDKIQGRLAWDHGFVSLLPSNHPYKNSQPFA